MVQVAILKAAVKVIGMIARNSEHTRKQALPTLYHFLRHRPPNAEIEPKNLGRRAHCSVCALRRLRSLYHNCTHQKFGGDVARKHSRIRDKRAQEEDVGLNPANHVVVQGVPHQLCVHKART